MVHNWQLVTMHWWLPKYYLAAKPNWSGSPLDLNTTHVWSRLVALTTCLKHKNFHGNSKYCRQIQTNIISVAVGYCGGCLSTSAKQTERVVELKKRPAYRRYIIKKWAKPTQARHSPPSNIYIIVQLFSSLRPSFTIYLFRYHKGQLISITVLDREREREREREKSNNEW